MDDLVNNARLFATELHQRIDQRRKYSNQPYDVHLKAVADMVAGISADQEMIAAAWLHDTVEDTSATIEDIAREFGHGIARLVEELTDVSRPGDGNRAARKMLDLRHTAQASARAKTIKLADIIDNCRDITLHDPKFALVYIKEALALMPVLQEADVKLYRRAERVLRESSKAAGHAGPAGVHEPEAGMAAHFFAANQWGVMRDFTRVFTAKDIAGQLPCFDADRPAQQAFACMQSAGLAVAGVRRDGCVCGYILSADLCGGDWARLHQGHSAGTNCCA